jgi:membrane protein
LIAAGVTFYLILGLFPGIAALVSIYRLFVDPQTMVNHLDMVASVAPGGAVDVLREQLTRLGQQTNTSLGVSFSSAWPFPYGRPLPGSKPSLTV